MPAVSPTQFLSLAGLARRADVPYERAVRAVRAGKIAPDGVTGGAILFLPARAEELRAVIMASGSRQMRLPLR